jgi:VWFA-related protein
VPGRALAVLLLAAAGLEAAGQPVPSFGVGTERVTLTATAVDRKGRPVLDLRADELRVEENGRLQGITHFSRPDAAPARLLILVDASGSMTGDKPARARLAFLRLLDGLSPRDEAALASFDAEYVLRVPFTSDRRALLQGFDAVQSFGATALYDALGQAARDLGHAPGEGRRAIVSFTDGVDTASRRTPEQALDDARAAATPVYALSVMSPLDDPGSGAFVGASPGAAHVVRGPDVLRRWTAEAGGGVFVASDLPAVETAVTRILSEIRHQYRLGYDPPPGAPGFRRIDVSSTRKGVVVRTRRGYVAR